MSSIIDVGRGSHAPVHVGSGAYVDLDGFTPSGTGSLVVDFRVQLHEKTSVIQCFNEVNHVYAFGHDPEGSSVSITYLVFMGASCYSLGKFTPSSEMARFLGAYLDKKVSKKKSVVLATFRGFGTMRVMVTGFDASVYDPEMNICSVTLSGKCL